MNYQNKRAIRVIAISAIAAICALGAFNIVFGDPVTMLAKHSLEQSK